MEDILEQADAHRRHALKLGYGHYTAGRQAAKGHMWLGVPVVVLTAIVGTSIFATFSETPASHWKIITGLVSLLATVLAALQTFFGFSERAEKHKAAGARYGALRRDIELFALRYRDKEPSHRDQALIELEALTERLSRLAEDSPDLSDELYDRAVRRFVAPPVGPPSGPSKPPEPLG